MPLYGSTAAVKQILQATEGDAWDASTDARLVELQKLASAIIEQETGAVFLAIPAAPTAETVVVDAGNATGTLYLPKGVKTVSGIVENPTWDGTAWTEGTAVTTPYYRLAGRSLTGVYRTILGVGRSWLGSYAITGVWEDQVAGVPDDITAVANKIIAELFKKEKASPAGFTGLDGAVVPIRNVLKEPEVVAVLDANRVGVGVWF